ncbi:MAG: CAP domain-containing protein [Novosphingobium sp.]
MKFASALIALAAVLAFPAQAEAPGSFEARLLASHNAERARIGIAPLTWSPELAAQAQVWARSLAQRGAFEHSKERQGAGENLWMGTAGFYAPEAMVGAFVREGRYFRPGTFPAVSSTGNWFDVGHYTQLIWPGTQKVGCALATGKGRDVLVCRYFPAGNMIGQRVP